MFSLSQLTDLDYLQLCSTSVAPTKSHPPMRARIKPAWTHNRAILVRASFSPIFPNFSQFFPFSPIFGWLHKQNQRTSRYITWHPSIETSWNLTLSILSTAQSNVGCIGAAFCCDLWCPRREWDLLNWLQNEAFYDFLDYSCISFVSWFSQCCPFPSSTKTQLYNLNALFRSTLWATLS